jgi:hypothetical protein
MPTALSDDQLDIVLRHAQPLPPQDRDVVPASRRRAAARCRDRRRGVSRAPRQAQADLFRAPNFFGGARVPNHESKLRRATTGP